MKILLLDDEKLIIRALSFGLVKAGHEVIETHHPLEALSKITQAKLDLLILDYHLSLFSGLDLIKILHQNNQVIPVLILSSQKFTDREINDFKLAKDQVLSKDEPIADILDEIEHYIQSHIIPN